MEVGKQSRPRGKNGDSTREERVEWVNVGPHPRYARRTLLAIILVSLLFHAGLFFMMPDRFFALEPSKWGKPKTKEFMVHMLQPKPKEPEPRPDQYVQATDAPENKPDKTQNFSSKDQQAAQKIESKDKTGDTPEVENGEDPDSNALQTGNAEQQATIEEIVRQSRNDTQNEPPQDAQKAQPQQKAAEQAKPVQEVPPLPTAIVDDKPQDDSGEGYAEVLKAGKEQKMPDKPPQDREIPAVMTNPYVKMETPQVEQADASGMTPRPRPRLAIPGAKPSLLRKTTNGFLTPSGAVAWDSKMTAYDDYLDRMFEVISRKWHALNDSTPVNVNDSSTYVRVQFTLKPDGQVEDVKVLETNSSQSAQWRCLDAVQANAPYFEWTDEMKIVLGDHQDVVVQFYYR